MLSTPGPSLGACFLASAATFPERVALEVAGRGRTYSELAMAAWRLATCIANTPCDRPRLGAVFAARSEVAYAGVLGTLLAGRGYVPLNPKFPAARNAHMLSVSRAATLIVGSECAELMSDVISRVERSLTVLLPTVDDVSALQREHARHHLVGNRAIASMSVAMRPPAVDPAEIAYLLFTSGSTGTPKGVMVSHASALSFLSAVWSRYRFDETDRFSQTFDLTFDLSVFDMFSCWGRGASLHCVPADQLVAPDDFVRDHALTVWFSVPSVGMMMRTLGRLTPNAFPSLRWSLFCGERLPGVVAAAWQQAAPASVVENLYGPTEATIACTQYRWHSESLGECVDGTVPIGEPYPAMAAAIVDEQLLRVPHGERGELCVKGPQVTHGYWGDSGRTHERYVAMPWYEGPDNRWYRTGDIAYVGASGSLIHCGRNDDQIKLRGFRIELPEVEHAIREAAETPFAVVLPYPRNANEIVGLTAVVSGTQHSEDEILDRAKLILPDYMLPGAVEFVDEMPLNSNGKIDKSALLKHLGDKYR